MTISARNHKIPIQKRKSRKLIVFREGGANKKKAEEKAAAEAQKAHAERKKKEMEEDKVRWEVWKKNEAKKWRSKEENDRDKLILKYIKKEFESVTHADNKREYNPAIPYCEWLKGYLNTKEKRYNHIKGLIKRELYSDLLKFENPNIIYEEKTDHNYHSLLNTDLYGYTDTDRDIIAKDILKNYKDKIDQIIKENCSAEILSVKPDEPVDPDEIDKPDDTVDPVDPDDPDDTVEPVDEPVDSTGYINVGNDNDNDDDTGYDNTGYIKVGSDSINGGRLSHRKRTRRIKRKNKTKSKLSKKRKRRATTIKRKRTTKYYK